MSGERLVLTVGKAQEYVHGLSFINGSLHATSPFAAVLSTTSFSSLYSYTSSCNFEIRGILTMSETKTVQVSHLGGITAGYQMPFPYDPSKPTLVLVNSFTTSSELYRKQYQNEKLTSTMNLLAIELLGHGQTRTKAENWTYWDTAIMNLQVMESLGVNKAFVLGTSQGGWITVRMALLAPEKVLHHGSGRMKMCMYS